MESNELRIGNWITHPQNSENIFQVKPNTFEHAEMYRPIPLTEEWLVEFGFEIDCHLSGSTLYNYPNTDFFITFYHDLKYNKEKANTFWREVEYYGGHGRMDLIESVHTLQNVFYFHVLTGEELTIQD